VRESALERKEQCVREGDRDGGTVCVRESAIEREEQCERARYRGRNSERESAIEREEQCERERDREGRENTPPVPALDGRIRGP